MAVVELKTGEWGRDCRKFLPQNAFTGHMNKQKKANECKEESVKAIAFACDMQKKKRKTKNGTNRVGLLGIESMKG